MNKISSDFLASDCDELLIIDCDIILTAEDLKNLFSHDLPLVYGMYYKRQPKTELCLGGMFDGSTPPEDSNLWELRRSGRGLVRIKREVFERMKEQNGGPAEHYTNHGRDEWDFWPSGVVRGEMSSNPDGLPEYISEDWYFCERARQLGYKILADKRIAARHEGDCIFPIRYSPDMLPDILSRFSPDEISRAMAVAKEIVG